MINPQTPAMWAEICSDSSGDGVWGNLFGATHPQEITRDPPSDGEFVFF